MTQADKFMETYSGRKITFVDPDVSEIQINDIAGHLSTINRYTGATKYPYSVAQHSVLMARYWMDKSVHYQDVAYACLLHDAHEAFIGDVSSPLKALLPEYKKLEHIWTGIINDRFMVYDPSASSDFLRVIQDQVRDTDVRILQRERKALMPFTGNHPWTTDHFDPLPVTIQEWGSDYAANEFLAEFYRLIPTRMKVAMQQA